MGVDITDIGVQVKRFLKISMRICYRSVCNHPFIVLIVCFWVFLYKSFPFLFSLLVSASPVLVCTAALLGTLLSFGQSNIPEIDHEEDENVSHGIASLKSGVIGEENVAVRDRSFSVDRFIGEKRVREEEDKSDEEALLFDNGAHKFEGSVDHTPLIDEDLEGRFIDSSIHREALEHIGYIDPENVDHHYSLIQELIDENLGVDADKFVGGLAFPHEEDEWDASLKQINDNEEADDDGDDDDDDDDDDGAESSSPDASMADIIPMLDELHPLLREEALPEAHLSHDESESESATEESNESSEDSEDMENPAEEEDGEDEEAAHEDTEDGSKSAIKWTEDDQKNLMDLGTSELERNQRLENLIARRRARKNMRLMAEKNLIDFDGDDIPLNSIPPITTTRHNPFDIPYDPYDDIPGSAPSILLPRRNPFDIPYESGEEKPNLKEESFRQEFTSIQRDPVFRRHESFSVGQSSLGGSTKWRPYFVPERFASDADHGASVYPAFQRQLSEVSESKESSVPDTESVSSVIEEEGTKNVETDDMSNTDHVSIQVEHGSQSSEVDTEDLLQNEVRRDFEEITLGDAESHHESDSSLSEVGRLENHCELDLSLQEEGEPAVSFESNENQPFDEECSRSSISSLSEEKYERKSDVQEGLTGLNQVNNNHVECSRSSISSLSEEVDETKSDVREEGLTGLNQVSNTHVESGTRTRLSVEESELGSIVVDEIQHIEPVYDSSPQALEEFLSFSSICSDTQAEIAEMGTPSISAESSEKHGTEHPNSPERDAYDHAVNANGFPSQENDATMKESSTSDENGIVVPESTPNHLLVFPSDGHNDSVRISGEHFNHIEEHGPPADEDINDEEDELREFDEGLLSELDRIGDFSIIVGDPISSRSSIDSDEHDLSVTEASEDLPVIEVRSIEDYMNLAFENQLLIDETEQDEQTHSGSPTVEANSIEDIDISSKQVSVSDANGMQNIEEENEQPLINETEQDEQTHSGSPTVEANSIEDADISSKQVFVSDANGMQNIEEEYKQLLIDETKQDDSKQVSVSDANGMQNIEEENKQLLIDETKQDEQTHSGSLTVEANSIEDTDISSKQVSVTDANGRQNIDEENELSHSQQIGSILK